MYFLQFLSLPAMLIALGMIITTVVTGGLYVVGLMRRERTQDITAAKDASEFVIESLKRKIEVLEKKVEEAANTLIETNKRLDNLQIENKSLRDVLQGRDEDTQRFQAMGFKIMAEAESSKDMGPRILEAITQTQKNVERLYKVIEKHLLSMEERTVTVTTGGSIK